jgi:thioredoxin reductase (NADPH)
MAIIDERREQMFPVFTPAEIESIRRFGSPVRFAAGGRIVATGEPIPGMHVILAGRVAILQRHPFIDETPVVEHGPGEFIAEIASLTGRSALIDARAMTDVEALLVSPEQLRALLIADAELGERIMRALILRRVSLIEAGIGGPILIAPEAHPDVMRLRNFLTRNGYPHQVLDPDEDQDAAALIEQYATGPDDLPLVVCPDGTALKNPGETELARCLGMVGTFASRPIYDVAIVGAGPAGLATAVYAASEGLATIMFDSPSFGGQAGASARIENYFGFPTGISGQALVGRAYVQAQKFGTEMEIPVAVSWLDCKSVPRMLELEDGRRIRARSVVIASGARYRRPDIPNLPDFEGRGIWFWASPIEARMCQQQEVVLVGGGNSAGQAAVFLRNYASKVWMLVRRDLSETMSRYLIDRIESAPNIEVLTRTELVALSGAPGGHLERVRWRNKKTGEETEKEIRNVFLFTGATPATAWLRDCGVALDAHGFVPTGANGGAEARAALESNIRGVFAVGDVRSGSVKRVGAAIGEGAAVVAQLHAFLANEAQAIPPG